MPETKTIEIDEIVTPGDGSSAKADRSRSAEAGVQPTPEDPFAGFKKSLGWKTRATLWVTQKFLYLKGKPWGKWVIAPIIILAVLLAIPLGLIFITVMMIRSAILSFRPSR